MEGSRREPRALARISLALLLAAAVAVSLSGCGGSRAAGASGGPGHTGRYEGSELSPPAAARAVSLNNYLGAHVSLSQLHGRAVMLTFIYDHCPDVCPLMVNKLHTALEVLGRRAPSVQVMAVSVDPRGDTPSTVRAFLAAHRMIGRMQYLIGSKRELAPVWRRWGVGVQATPDQREVDHTALVYGISASGKLTTLYPSNFTPAEIAHDVPLLAAS